MNDIVLLMTGVLAKESPATSIVPKQPAIQLDNGVKNTTQRELNQLISSVKITPPEFAQINENDQTENYKIALKNSSDIMVADGYSPDEFNNFQAVNVKFPGESVLIAQQFNTDIVIARRYSTRRHNLPTLSYGNNGVAVRALQKLLRNQGYAVRVDGNFGALTESAVKAFQIDRNLIVDGIVGPRTWFSLTR